MSRHRLLGVDNVEYDLSTETALHTQLKME